MSEQPANQRGSPVTFRFTNIGPVKDAALNLGRLTVIAGRNNTGKTYIAYSLYGFLKTWNGWRRRAPFQLSERIWKVVTELAAMLCDDEMVSLPLSPAEIFDHRRELVSKLEEWFSAGLHRVFSSKRNDFRKSRLEVEIDGGAMDLPPSEADVSTARQILSITHGGDEVVALLSPSRPEYRGRTLEPLVLRAYFALLLRDLFPDPFILSAERFGISLFYRELDFTKNQLVDMLQKLGDEAGRRSVSPFLLIDRTTSRYALPIKDNIDFTRSIPDLPKHGSALAGLKLFDDVKDLVEGYYGNAADDIRFISKARGKGRSFNIPLHLASSSARGLSDLYFFLRHTATRDQLLIIDEPESHLDTRNQMLFARMLARFVTAGLRVLITTHSDYLVKELNNLIMLSRDFPEKETVAKKLGYQPGEGLDQGSIRAYVAEDGGLTECEIGAFGIEMPVFDDTIDQINEAAIELSSRTMEGT